MLCAVIRFEYYQFFGPLKLPQSLDQTTSLDAEQNRHSLPEQMKPHHSFWQAEFFSLCTLKQWVFNIIHWPPCKNSQQDMNWLHVNFLCIPINELLILTYEHILQLWLLYSDKRIANFDFWTYFAIMTFVYYDCIKQTLPSGTRFPSASFVIAICLMPRGTTAWFPAPLPVPRPTPLPRGTTAWLVPFVCEGGCTKMNINWF